MAAVKVFDTEACGRCGGSGHYSYNQIDGTRCYGCGGSGKKIVRSQAKMADEWAAAKRAMKEPTVAKMEIGDELAIDGKWKMIEWIDVNKNKPRGWSIAPDGTKTETAWAAVIVFTDGTTRRTSTSEIIRRRALTDALLKRVSEKTAAHISARIAAAKEEN